jgi:hypothetical protein
MGTSLAVMPASWEVTMRCASKDIEQVIENVEVITGRKS